VPEPAATDFTKDSARDRRGNTGEFNWIQVDSGKFNQNENKERGQALRRGRAKLRPITPNHAFKK
jgi:hypothetical protein